MTVLAVPEITPVVSITTKCNSSSSTFLDVAKAVFEGAEENSLEYAQFGAVLTSDMETFNELPNEPGHFAAKIIEFEPEE